MAFRKLYEDILNVNAKFPLDTLSSMKDFLAYQARKEEMNKAYDEYDLWDDIESSEASLPLSSKGAPTTESTLLEEGSFQQSPLRVEEEPRQPSPPKEDPSTDPAQS